MICLPPRIFAEFVRLFESATDVPALSGGIQLSGIPAPTLRRRLRGLIPEILDYWLITVGYAGVHEVTFEDAPEWVDLEPTEDSDFLRYRDPESLRWRQLPIAEAAVYQVDTGRLLNAIADALSVLSTQRDGIDRPLIDNVLWRLGTARLGTGLDIPGYVVRALDPHFDAVVSRLAEEWRAGVVLSCATSVPKCLRWPPGVTVVSLVDFLVPERSSTMLDLQRLARRVSELLNDPLDVDACAVLFDADLKVLTIAGKAPWVLNGEAQARAVEYMAKLAHQGIWSAQAKDILRASRAPGQIGGARTVPDLFKKNPHWTHYIERKERGRYGFKLE